MSTKRPIWEWLLLVVVIAVSVMLVGSVFRYQVKIDRQNTMHSQLELLRTSLILYKSIYKSNPSDLKQLVEGTFTLPGEEVARRFIDRPPLLVNGKVVDPFGSPFLYDPATGWIKSGTKGYEFW